jgi:DNA-binding CsgD family transcriptional regulator
LAGPETVSPQPSRAPAGAAGLTKRELEIALLAAEGMPNAQIASALFVAEQTVKFHLSNIFRKLGVSNRTEAAAKVRALGLGVDDEAGEQSLSG